jgi:OOP family OmpA-OmpF porin
MQCRTLILTAIAVAISSTGVVAQELSDDEILQRFLIQREAYTAARTGTGSTRGLSIVTVDDDPVDAAPVDGGVVVADVGPEQQPPVEGDTPPDATTSTDATPDGDSSGGLVEVAVADAPPTIDPNQVGILPEEYQVNVRISFDYDSALLKPDQQPILDQMCRVMAGSDIRLFRIMGHTDSAGSDDYNEELSLLRAEEVKRRLVSDCGIDPVRLEAMGLGERFLFDTADPQGAENRRVEFQALS